jgi:hypothetical protein
MNTIIVSMRDFITLFPKHASTVRHFINSRGRRVISGKAELADCGHAVEYFHDLFNGLLTIFYQGIVLYSEEVYAPEEINAAFMKADAEFFLNMFRPISHEDVSFLETDKGKRCKHYETSKKAIKDNHRGQHGRYMDHKAMRPEIEEKARKAMKAHMVAIGAPNFTRKHISLTNAVEIAWSEDYFEFPTNTDNSKHRREGANYLFLAEGMNVLIEADGTVGALSFNPHYLGSRIIRAA